LRRTAFTFLSSLVALLCHGQTTSLQGKIFSALEGRELVGATISLVNESSSETYIAITDGTGDYFLEQLPAGSYSLEVQSIGHDSFNMPLLEMSIEDVSRKLDVRLQPTSTWIEQVEVVGSVAPVRMVDGMQVYNVAAIPSLRGTSLADVFEAIPSISANTVDGTIELRGGNAVILLNGKPVNRAPIAVLRSLQAAQIKEVQVNTSPKAKYSAEGSAGVINIVTNSTTQKGFSGDLDFSAGNIIQSGYVGLNYNNSKVNLSLEPSVRFINAPISRDRTSTFPNGLKQVNTYDGDFIYKYFDVTAGLDIYLDSTSTIFFSGNLYKEGSDDRINGLFNSTFGSAMANTSFDGLLDYDVPGYILDLNYQKDFKRPNQNLSAGFLYEFYTDQENYDYSYIDGLTSINSQRLIKNGGDDFLYQANLDYSMPLGKTGAMDIGTGYFLNAGDDFSRFYDVDISGEISERTQLFNEYDEKNEVMSAYLSLSKEWGKLSSNVGVRGEQTNLELNLTERAQERLVNQDYDNLFPSANLTFSANDKNDISLSYSRRITRPDGSLLNPFVNELDTSRLWAGNPDLNPEFIDAFELSFSNSGNNSNFSVITYYRLVDNLIRMATRLNDENVSLFRPENFSNSQTMGADLSLSFSPVEWWDFRLGSNFNKILFDEELPFVINSEIDQFKTTFSNDFQLPGDLSFSFSGRYTNAQKTYQGEIEANGVLHVGLDKELFDGNGGLSFMARNFLNTDDKRVDLITANNVLMSDFFQDRDRILGLNFYYNFGKSFDKRQKREREEEEDRGNGEDIDKH